MLAFVNIYHSSKKFLLPCFPRSLTLLTFFQHLSMSFAAFSFLTWASFFSLIFFTSSNKTHTPISMAFTSSSGSVPSLPLCLHFLQVFNSFMQTIYFNHANQTVLFSPFWMPFPCLEPFSLLLCLHCFTHFSVWLPNISNMGLVPCFMSEGMLYLLMTSSHFPLLQLPIYFPDSSAPSLYVCRNNLVPCCVPSSQKSDWKILTASFRISLW